MSTCQQIEGREVIRIDTRRMAAAKAVGHPTLGVRQVASIAAILIIVSVCTSSSTVQTGYVGVITTFGSVEPAVLGPGFHLVIPFARRIVQIETRVQPHTFRRIDAASSELQSVKLTGT